jgi:hypothetical protein
MSHQGPTEDENAETVELVRARFSTPSDDPEMFELALKAIRCLAKGHLKSEPCADTSPDGVVEITCADVGADEVCAADREGPINKQLLDDILHETKDRSSCKRLDPAQGCAAEEQWSHLLEELEISDSRLRQTHHRISGRFNLGPHRGQSVAKLITDFESGMARPEQLTPLVAAKWKGCLWAIFGNRRLHASKEFVRRHGAWPCGQAPRVRVIVHDFHGSDIHDLHLRHVFQLKALQAMSTRNAGFSADMRRRF